MNFNPRLDTLVREKFGPGYPSMNELEQRTALAFVNTNPTFNIPAPLPENVIPVGGIHIRETKPLPKVRNHKTFQLCFSKTMFFFTMMMFLGLRTFYCFSE